MLATIAQCQCSTIIIGGVFAIYFQMILCVACIVHTIHEHDEKISSLIMENQLNLLHCYWWLCLAISLSLRLSLRICAYKVRVVLVCGNRRGYIWFSCDVMLYYTVSLDTLFPLVVMLLMMIMIMMLLFFLC